MFALFKNSKDDYKTSSDETLMTLVQQGHQQAYKELVDRHRKRVTTIAYRILSYGQTNAEDITQLVFLKIWQNPQAYNPTKAKFTTWLYRITINQALDEKRKKVTHQLADDFDTIDPTESAEQGLMQQNTQKALLMAIEKLPEKQKLVLLLTYFEDKPNAEVAKILDISVKAVESHLVRGRKFLRQSLSPQKNDL